MQGSTWMERPHGYISQPGTSRVNTQIAKLCRSQSNLLVLNTRLSPTAIHTRSRRIHHGSRMSLSLTQPWKSSITVVDKQDHDQGEERFTFYGNDPSACSIHGSWLDFTSISSVVDRRCRVPLNRIRVNHKSNNQFLQLSFSISSFL